jgi:hypothetical protein
MNVIGILMGIANVFTRKKMMNISGDGFAN